MELEDLPAVLRRLPRGGWCGVYGHYCDAVGSL